MKYFIFRGYLPVPGPNLPWRMHPEIEGRDERKKVWNFGSIISPFPKEGENVLLRVKGSGRISVFVHNIFSAHLLVVSRSQSQAYRLISPFKAIVSILLGYPHDESAGDILVELNERPNSLDSTLDIANRYKRFGFIRHNIQDLANSLDSGSVLQWDQMEFVSRYLTSIFKKKNLLNSFSHLERSHTLFSGNMVSSYYEAHYRHERSEKTQYEMQKQFYEHKNLLELAFLSAFRALEALLNTSRIKKRDIHTLLSKIDDEYMTQYTSSKYRSFFEIFSGHKKYWKYSEIIQRYLDLRNSVAAHANPRPPYVLLEDQVFEIQHLVESMLYELVGVTPE